MPIHLEFTDERFVFAKKSYPGIPLLADTKYYFIEPVCKYLRHLVIFEHMKTTSAKTYAEYFRSFWYHLEKEKLNYQEVTDTTLISWFNTQEKNGVDQKVIASRCDVIFDWYVWLELNGEVENIVRVPGFNDTDKFIPHLTARIPRGKKKGRRGSKYGIVSGVRPKVVGNGILPIPTSEEVSRLYIAADKPDSPDLTERNHLLIDWYVQVGLRRVEWCSLVKSQILPWDKIASLQKLGYSHELYLTETKGGNPRYVGVLPDLLEKTLEYIEGPRADIVARFKAKYGTAYQEPLEIFLSNKTGKSLDLTAVTNLLTSIFRKAGVDSHGHRLRAVHLTFLFEAEIAAEEAKVAAHPESKMKIDYEFVLRKVAERAGHSDIDSLRPYLSFVRKRRARAESKEDPVALQLKIEADKQELILLEYRREQLTKEIDVLKSERSRLANEIVLSF